MVRTKQKGQGLVEFALILPVFLLMLVGIVEAARVIWAYITIQTAAREAARYAITGKPYIDIENIATDTGPGGPAAYPGSNCLRQTGEPDTDQPWLCDPLLRAYVIESVAISRAYTAVPTGSPLCRSALYDTCLNQPGAFGVRVTGQYISPTISLTQPQVAIGHAGTQGLMVQVKTFYNVQMIDPIFDTIMGGRFIQVQGELEMQNEGIDTVLGSVPPSSIGNTAIITGTGSGPGVGPHGEQIWSLSGYRIQQNSTLVVHLESHSQGFGPYDIFLNNTTTLTQPAKICPNVNTGSSNSGDFNCFVGVGIPVGFYDLYSTYAGDLNPLTTAPQQVEVVVGDVPQIVINDGDDGFIWAANSVIDLNLVAHQVPDGPFNLYFNYGGPFAQTIATNVPATTGPISWQVPDVGSLCPQGGTACVIETRSVSDTTTTYASTGIYINQPEIALSGGNMVYARGETMHVLLRGHTPGVAYDLKLSNGGTDTIWLGRTPPMNEIGDSDSAVEWTVLETDWPGPGQGWPDGFYDITSHPAAGGTPRSIAEMTPANQIAILEDVQVETPDGPYITVNGGYAWPINSFINIRVHQHPDGDNPYYLQFGSWRVPVTGTTPANTFDVNSNGTATIGYRIPATATETVPMTFTISSFKNSDNTLAVAQRDVRVFPVPLITVLEGSRVLPDATINIRITNHQPNANYKIFYANKELFTMQTNANGRAQRPYNLANLPASPPPDFSNPANYGLPFEMYSRAVFDNAKVATTTLTLDTADLRITKVELPATATINTSVPMTVTIQNTKPVTISRYFDIDLYLDPSPLVPAYRQGQFNFPGDVKLWRNFVAAYGHPGDTFKVNQPFLLGDYGAHTFYGYADTSDFLRYENNEVNNVMSGTLTISCNYSFISDNFGSYNASAWTPVRYNSGDTQIASGYPRASGGLLQMRNDGESTAGSDDNASNRGYVFLHRTTPISTTPGFEVQVKLVSLSGSNTNSAKAGLELRDDPQDSTSPKIEFNMYRTGTNSRRLQVLFREADGSLTSVDTPNVSLNLSATNPMWLRIKREPGSNTFTFYYAAQTPTPTVAQWTAYYTATIPMSQRLYAGLFNASYNDGTNQTAEFDNFSFADTASCPAPLGSPPVDLPPGLTLCTDPLQEKGFDRAPLNAWIIGFNQGVVQSPGSAYNGNFKLMAPSFDGQYYNPFFYQKFDMPDWVISTTTTLDLSLFKNVDKLVDGNDPQDRFYAVVATGPNLSATLITTPTEVANGDIGDIPYSPTDWRAVNVRLPVRSGINLENYAGQQLYLYFYNNTNRNANCPPTNPNCGQTKFYFDQVSLTPCTSQPLPGTISTRIKGDVILHRLGVAPEKIAGVKVWAYAENGSLYETFTIQNGEFNFYNLPAVPGGTKYIIYAEYHIIDALDPTKVETLAANTTVLLQTIHTNNNPLTTRLDLFAITP